MYNYAMTLYDRFQDVAMQPPPRGSDAIDQLDAAIDICNIQMDLAGLSTRYSLAYLEAGGRKFLFVMGHLLNQEPQTVAQIDITDQQAIDLQFLHLPNDTLSAERTDWKHVHDLMPRALYDMLPEAEKLSFDKIHALFSLEGPVLKAYQ